MSHYTTKNVRVTTTRQPAYTTSRVISSRQPMSTHRTIRTEPLYTHRTVTHQPMVTHRVVSSEPVITRREHYVSSEPILTEHRVVRTQTPDSTKLIRQMERQLEGELEGRHRDWENQVGHMQQDFFQSNTSAGATGTTVRPTEILDINTAKDLFCDTSDGGKVFRVRFDLRDFEPEDINVRTEFGILHVLANRVNKSEGGADKSTRRFNRTVELPNNVDPDKLTSSISEDGILTVEAPVPPEYSDVTKPETATEVQIVPSISRTITSETDSTGTRLNTPVVLGPDDAKRVKLVVDIGRGFQPDDVTVHAYATKIAIEARHEENVDGRVSRKSYSREFDLPDPVDPWTTRAKWNENGRLTMGAMNLGYRLRQDEAIDKVIDDLPEDGKVCKVQPV